MKYNTYKKKPTKYRQKEAKIMKIILVCIILIPASLNALISSFSSKATIEPQKEETSLLDNPVALNEASSEHLPNGDRIIYTKTPYFDNEVQVWLACEQAAKKVGKGKDMINDLMAIAWTESRTFNYRSVGDGNKSYGAFQIHLGYHPEITKEQALDPYWAAEWTAKRLIAKGWEKDREFAIRSHNGNPTAPQTIPYIQTVNKYLSMK